MSRQPPASQLDLFASVPPEATPELTSGPERDETPVARVPEPEHIAVAHLAALEGYLEGWKR